MSALLDGATVGPDDRQSWLAARRSGIGASEAAAVLGLCPYTTPRELYLRKVGLLPDKDESYAMRCGRHMEPFLAAEYRRRFPGVGLAEQVFRVHPDHPHMIATLDGLRDDGLLVEFKTANFRTAAKWGADESDEVPEGYLVQVQHQMAVTGAGAAHVFASIGGDECRLFVVERNESIITHLIEEEAIFWRCVELRDPPPPKGVEDIRLNPWIYPGTGGQVRIDEELEDLVEEWIAVKGVARVADADADRLKAAILERLGTSAGGVLSDGRVLSRKIQFRKGGTYERKDSTFTDLRIKEARRRDG